MSLAPRAFFTVAAAALACTAALRAGPPGGSRAETEPPGPVRVPPVEGIPGPLYFETPTLAFVPKATLRVTTEARLLEGVTLPASGLAGDLSELEMVRVDIGFGSRIEVRIQGAFREYLRIDAKSSHARPPTAVTGRTKPDTGDFSISTIAQVMPERGVRPVVRPRIEAKLPNTTERRGIGTNTTDVLLSAPVQIQLGRLLVAADLGLGILSVPTDAQTQDDVLLCGLAAGWKASRQ